MEVTDSSAQRFSIFERGEFSLMVIKGDIKESHLPELLDTLKGLMESNTHLLVNFLLSKTLTESLFEVFVTIKYLLGENEKLLSLMYLSETMKENLPVELKKTLDFKLVLYDSLEQFKEKTYFPPLNLLKTIISQTLSTLLFKYKLPLIRRKMFIKEFHKNNDFKENFMGDFTSGHILTNDKSFFHIGFSYSNKFLDNIQAMTADGEIFDSIKFGNEIINSTLKDLSNLDFKLESLPDNKLHTKKLPKVEFEYSKELFLLFTAGMTVVLPLTSYYGDIFLEIWIPKKFEKKVLESINS